MIERIDHRDAHCSHKARNSLRPRARPRRGCGARGTTRRVPAPRGIRARRQSGRGRVTPAGSHRPAMYDRPTAATPSALPVLCMVDRMPAATPACCGGVRDSASDTSGAMIRPMPAPSISSGTSIAAMPSPRDAARACSTWPTDQHQRTDLHQWALELAAEAAPPIDAAKNAAPSTANTKPECNGDAPSVDCRCRPSTK